MKPCCCSDGCFSSKRFCACYPTHVHTLPSFLRRETRNKLYKLQDIVLIALCSVISGVDDWVGKKAFAEEHETWLRSFLELPMRFHNFLG